MKSSDDCQAARGRWLAFWGSLNRAGTSLRGDPEEVFAELDRRYREEQRHYHNWRHICACLDELERARHLAIHPASVELAVWFHDAVYDPGTPDNEERSARLTRDCAERMNLPPNAAEEAENLVLATRHFTGDSPSAGPGGLKELCPQDSSLIRDIDLSILGKPKHEFDAYEEAIRREYAFVPDRQRWTRRVGILEGFVARPSIYETGHFQQRYERRARRNMTRSIRRLRRLLGS